VAIETTDAQRREVDERRPWTPYLLVLGSAVACYAALGLVLRALPNYVADTLHGNGLGVGLAVGAPSVVLGSLPTPEDTSPPGLGVDPPS